MYLTIRPTKRNFKFRFMVYNILSHLECICFLIFGILNDEFGISELRNCFAEKGAQLEVTFTIPF